MRERWWMGAAVGVLLAGAGCAGEDGDAESADAGPQPTDDASALDTSDLDGAPSAPDVALPPSDALDDAAVDVDAATEPPVSQYAACYPTLVETLGIDPSLDGLPVGEHCVGSSQQSFENVERVVFLGDSITVGVGAGRTGSYRALLSSRLQERFPGVTIDNCSRGGATNQELVDGQIPECFPEPELRPTLVILTSGGNDLFPLAIGRPTPERAAGDVDRIVGQFRDALAWLYDPANTPGGVQVVFANPYEFTDGTGVLNSCERLARLLPNTWEDGPAVFGRLAQGYAQLAIEFGADVYFLAEQFCGHGHNREDPNSPCYDRRGDLWLDADCIHPNAAGHAAIADGIWTLIAGASGP